MKIKREKKNLQLHPFVCDVSVYPRAMHPRAMHLRAMHPRAMHPRAIHPRAMHPRAIHYWTERGGGLTQSKRVLEEN